MTQVYIAKKIYNGNVSVRDYLVKNAIKKGDALIIKVDDKQMTLSPDRLKDYKPTGMVFPMKYGMKAMYELYDYVWMPDATLFGKEEDSENKS